MTGPGHLADEMLETYLDTRPVEATLAGLRDRDDRLPDVSEAGEQALADQATAIAERARKLDPDTLDATDRITRAVVASLAEATRDQLSVRAMEYTITDSVFSPVFGLLASLSMVSITEPAHAEGYLARVAGLPRLLAEAGERHRAGIAAGRLPLRRLTEAAVAYLDRYLAAPADDPLRRPAPPTDLPGFGTERDRLLSEQLYPALRRYRDLLAAEVVPHGRPDDRGGLCWLPDGEAYYARLARVHTTAERAPERLHQVGLELVAGLADEYAALGPGTLGTGAAPEILARLRDDPALRWRDADELLAAARACVDRAEAAAPGWFGALPAGRCTVQPVPPAEAPGAPAAYYLEPALDGTRPGIFFANPHEADQRGRAAYEAIAFHEAVPGHHVQFTLAQELTGLPMIRRVAPFTAYIEGWGLYAERLADEMGLYSDDLYRLGMLSEDSMRAARLVVDTGLHALGWSRQRAADYLREHTACSEPEIAFEVDRYLAAPGQALSYMVGRLEIQRLRQEARQALGSQFDIRDFHDAVLGAGPLPLTVLDESLRSR